MLPGIALTACAIVAAPQTRPADAADLRVMTFNIRYGTADDGADRWERRREQLFDLIRREAPDVLGVQEALRFQLDEIRAALPAYARLGVGRDDGREKGEYSAILYRADRLKPLESGTFWFSDTPAVPGSKHWGNTLPRICTWARFEDLGAGPGFVMYNVHLDHQSQPSRVRSAALLAERIADRRPREPVIVTGDFNAGESNPAVRLLLDPPATRPDDAGARRETIKLLDSFRVLHPDEKEVGTFNGFKGTTTGEKIDYVLVSPGVEVLEARIVRDRKDGRYPSDHFPVVARIRLPRR
ncbi:MAG: endonuclease [Phycisphaerae bacterium]